MQKLSAPLPVLVLVSCYFVTKKMVYLGRLYSEIDSGCFHTICLNIFWRNCRVVVQFFLTEEDGPNKKLIILRRPLISLKNKIKSAPLPTPVIFIKSLRDY